MRYRLPSTVPGTKRPCTNELLDGDDLGPVRLGGFALGDRGGSDPTVMVAPGSEFSEAPQPEQKRLPAEISAPQLLHFVVGKFGT
jgi:hypothetical protein